MAVAPGCASKSSGDADTGVNEEQAGSDDSASGDSGTQASGSDSGDTAAQGLPDNPSPFTLTFSGALDADLVFDAPTCSHPYGSSNLRIFWRNEADAHYYLLNADLLGTFEGPGTYDAKTHGAKVKLQEEAGGSYGYFATGDGDLVEITIEGFDEKAEQIWGSFSFSQMQSSAGDAVAATPMPVPIWCDVID